MLNCYYNDLIIDNAKIDSLKRLCVNYERYRWELWTISNYYANIFGHITVS